jgi:hypothetical protein
MSDIDSPFDTFCATMPRVQSYLERHFRVAPPFEGREGDDSWLIVLERSADLGAAAVDLFDPRLEPRAWVRIHGRERKIEGPERQLPTVQNHRPLAARLGPSGGGID